MLNFDHYNKLKEASIVPHRIREIFGDDRGLGKVLIEMCVPAIRVAIYAATNELQLFSDLLEKMKKAKKLAPYFHVRMNDEKLFRSLSLLGVECLECLLSELDCSDAVFNGLHDSVINQDPDAFEKVMQGWGGSSSKVTSICRLLYLELFLNDCIERIIKESNKIDEIPDPDQQNQEGKVFARNVFDNIIMNIKEVFKDELDDELIKRLEKIPDEILDDDTPKFATDTRKLDEVVFDWYKEGCVKGVLSVDPNANIVSIEKAPENFLYKVLLIAYDFLATKTSISQPAKRVIKEILFVPEYETIWKQYEVSGSIDYLKDEITPVFETQPTPQIEEPTIEEPQPEQLSAADYNQEIPKKRTGKQKDIIRFFFIKDTYFEVDPDESPEYCTIVNEKFKKIDKVERAMKFKAFIKLLARHSCIAPVNVVMQSCAYDFTGIGFRKPYEHVPVFWNKEKVDVLLFICTKFFKKSKNADYVKAVRIFHVKEVYEDMQNPSKVAEDFNDPKFLKEFQEIFGEL